MRSNKIEAYKTHLSLGSEQKEILIGILLGDATLETADSGRTYRLKVEHSLNQKSYLEHLYEKFRDWVLSPPRLKEITLLNGKTYSSMAFSTLSHASLRFYGHQFYKGRSKVVPRLIGRWLTPKALAYWYMDDGSIKSKKSKGVIFNTQGYAKHEVIRLARILENKFALEAKPRRQKEGYQIYISGRSYERFKTLTSSFILPEMRYKLPEARRTYLPKV